MASSSYHHRAQQHAAGLRGRGVRLARARRARSSASPRRGSGSRGGAHRRDRGRRHAPRSGCAWGRPRFRWVAVHRDYVPGRRFVDEQVKGPFSHWIHQHLFEPLGPAASRYTDRIEFGPPFGTLGAAAGSWLARPRTRANAGVPSRHCSARTSRRTRGFRPRPAARRDHRGERPPRPPALTLPHDRRPPGHAGHAALGCPGHRSAGIPPPARSTRRRSKAWTR